MKQADTQSIAIEVKGISCSLENLKESRERHDKKMSDKTDATDLEIKNILLHIAADSEFKKILSEEFKELKNAVKILTAMSERAKGGWWAIGALSTIFSIIGSFIALNVSKLLK